MEFKHIVCNQVLFAFKDKTVDELKEFIELSNSGFEMHNVDGIN